MSFTVSDKRSRCQSLRLYELFYTTSITPLIQTEIVIQHYRQMIKLTARLIDGRLMFNIFLSLKESLHRTSYQNASDWNFWKSCIICKRFAKQLFLQFSILAKLTIQQSISSITHHLHLFNDHFLIRKLLGCAKLHRRGSLKKAHFQ